MTEKPDPDLEQYAWYREIPELKKNFQYDASPPKPAPLSLVRKVMEETLAQPELKEAYKSWTNMAVLSKDSLPEKTKKLLNAHANYIKYKYGNNPDLYRYREIRNLARGRYVDVYDYRLKDHLLKKKGKDQIIVDVKDKFTFCHVWKWTKRLIASSIIFIIFLMIVESFALQHVEKKIYALHNDFYDDIPTLSAMAFKEGSPSYDCIRRKYSIYLYQVCYERNFGKPFKYFNVKLNGPLPYVSIFYPTSHLGGYDSLAFRSIHGKRILKIYKNGEVIHYQK